MLGLSFSGGKDSLACWYLCRGADPIVFYVNTGKAYPETLAIVEEVRSQAKEFIEIKTDQQAQNDIFGIPSDLVPIDHTGLGMTFAGKKPVMVQSYLGCCHDNISAPIMKAVHARGVRRLIRGQRLSDGHKAPSRNGHFVEGVEFLHPIEDWSTVEVLEFIVEKRGSLPAHYHIGHSSLDCYDCTAFAGESGDRIAWMEEAHPDLLALYKSRRLKLQDAIRPSARAYGVTS